MLKLQPGKHDASTRLLSGCSEILFRQQHGLDLPNPRLGIVAGFSSFTLPLLERGFANNPAFGGSGAVELDQLPAGRVYATLARTADFNNLSVNVALAGKEVHGISLDSVDDIAYIVITPGDFDADGDVDGRDFLAWQRNPSVGDLADWQGNFGAGSLSALRFPPSALNIAVPEPNAMVTMLGCLALSVSCRIKR